MKPNDFSDHISNLLSQPFQFCDEATATEKEMTDEASAIVDALNKLSESCSLLAGRVEILRDTLQHRLDQLKGTTHHGTNSQHKIQATIHTQPRR